MLRICESPIKTKGFAKHPFWAEAEHCHLLMNTALKPPRLQFSYPHSISLMLKMLPLDSDTGILLPSIRSGLVWGVFKAFINSKNAASEISL